MTQPGKTIDPSEWDDLPPSTFMTSDWFEGSEIDLGKIQQRVTDIERLHKLDIVSLERSLQALADHFRVLDKSLSHLGLIVVEPGEDEQDWNERLGLIRDGQIHTAGGVKAQVVGQGWQRDPRLYFILYGDDVSSASMGMLNDAIGRAARWWRAVMGTPGPAHGKPYWLVKLGALALRSEAGQCSARLQRLGGTLTDVYTAHLVRKGRVPFGRHLTELELRPSKSWFIDLDPRVCEASALAVESLVTTVRQSRMHLDGDEWFPASWFQAASESLTAELLRKGRMRSPMIGRAMSSSIPKARARYEYNARLVAERPCWHEHKDAVLKALHDHRMGKSATGRNSGKSPPVTGTERKAARKK